MAARFCWHLSIPICYRLTYIALYPEFSTVWGWAALYLYNPDILVTQAFCAFSLLDTTVDTSPPQRLGSGQSDNVCSDSSRCLCLLLCPPNVYNKLSLLPYLATVMFFPFLFMSFFIYYWPCNIKRLTDLLGYFWCWEWCSCDMWSP